MLLNQLLPESTRWFGPLEYLWLLYLLSWLTFLSCIFLFSKWISQMHCSSELHLRASLGQKEYRGSKYCISMWLSFGLLYLGIWLYTQQWQCFRWKHSSEVWRKIQSKAPGFDKDHQFLSSLAIMEHFVVSKGNYMNSGGFLSFFSLKQSKVQMFY